MDKRYEALFTPWKIGNVEIKNRIVLCPMGGTSLFGWVEPHHFDKEAAAFFLKRAENNVGLIIPGIAPLRNMLGNGWLYKANGAFKKLKPFMEKIHATGAKLFVQLTAGFGRSFALDDMMALLVRNKVLGAIARPIIDPSYLCAAPSASPSRWAEDTMCREMTLKEIKKIIFAYAETAKKLMDAGVDCIKLEGRAKSAYYAAIVTGAYRHVLDDVAAGRPVDPVWRDEVEHVSHRHYSTGFYYGEPGQYTESARYLREWQVIAMVTACDEQGNATLSLRNKFAAGDRVELVGPDTKPFAFTVPMMEDLEGNPLAEPRTPQMEFRMKLPKPVPAWSILRHAVALSGK